MSGVGSADLRKYRKTGVQLTPLRTIRATCCECMSDYWDGRRDCGRTACPNYPYMPYRQEAKKEGE